MERGNMCRGQILMKNENQIWSDIRETVLAGLTANAITGFDVISANQPSKATIEQPTIWIDRVSARRYGWQGTDEREDVDNLYLDNTYYEEIMFQITALKKRNTATDTVLTMTSGDVLHLLTTYFNGSGGIGKLETLDFSCLKVGEVRESTFISNSDLYEKTPSFDITLTHMQTVEAEETPTITGSTITTEGL